MTMLAWSYDHFNMVDSEASGFRREIEHTFEYLRDP